MKIPDNYAELGKVGFTAKGEWQADVTYNRYDVVFYEESSYIVLTDNLTESVPTEENNNYIIMARGLDLSTINNFINANYLGKVPAGIYDLADPPEYNVFIATVGSTNLPSEIGGNAFMCFRILPYNSMYDAMICFGFGSARIAYKNKIQSETWSDWSYLEPF